MTTTYEPNVVLSTKEYDVVGKRPLRHDGTYKLTGSAKYGEDFILPGMLHTKWLRGPHAHAVIKSIDTTDAESLEGVRGVGEVPISPPPAALANAIYDSAGVRLNVLPNES